MTTQTTDARLEKKIFAGQLDDAMNFAQKVWALTARIPAGKVTTYGALARTLDSKAYRAVGAALHRNPYVPMVPCHRVVGSDGSLTGYALGLEKKRKLLAKEGVAFAGDKADLTKSFVQI